MSDFAPTEPLRAENNPKFYSRFMWLGLGAIFFGAYCFYDGYYTYPDQIVRGNAFMELAEEVLTDEEKVQISKKSHDAQESYLRSKKIILKDSERKEQWLAIAAENEWSEKPPAKLRTEMDVQMQYLMIIPCVIAALWLLSTWYFSIGRWFEIRDGEIHTSWGQSFPLTAITKIDKKQWRDKGIARLRYVHENRPGKFVVDNYKFHRKSTDRILYLIEQAVSEDKIVNGPPESLAVDSPKVGDETVHDVDDHTTVVEAPVSIPDNQ